MSRSLDPVLSRRATELAQAGDIARAYRLLEQGVKDGNAYAAATLADWRMTGALIRRDLAASRDLFGAASDLGLSDAEPIYIALLANGAGGIGRKWALALDRLRQLARRDPTAQRQLELIAAMDLDVVGDPQRLPPVDPVCAAPKIELQRNLLSEAECTYLIELAQPQLQPAVVIHPQSGQPMRDPIRMTSVAAFPFVAEDPVVHAINRRIAAATATTYAQGEPLQVLSYGPLDEYKLHSDTLPAGHIQRGDTLLVWLNEEFEGGETDFPRAGLKLRGKPGDAVHFRNVLPGGAPDPAAWHAGLPVRSGNKFILSKWIRVAPLDLSGPPGRPF